LKLPYLILDVFTRQPLQGNALAVIPQADGLLDGEMQAIAREFNLSETVFICKPQNERNTASVRIFTPYQELPFAGHPTVGAAVVLGLGSKATALRIEERVGLVTALFERIDRRTGSAPLASRTCRTGWRWRRRWASSRRISDAMSIYRRCFRLA
jgi:trans-2,3-dihydro-3-hydroxyanthranilate isomerase